MHIPRTRIALGVFVLATGLANALVQQYCSDLNTGSRTAARFSIYQSNGYCSSQCRSGYAFAVIQGQNCWCSNYAPANQLPISSCRDNCTGFPSENCGSVSDNLFGYVALNLAPSGILGAVSNVAPTSSAQASTTSQAVSNRSTLPSHTSVSTIFVSVPGPAALSTSRLSSTSSLSLLPSPTFTLSSLLTTQPSLSLSGGGLLTSSFYSFSSSYIYSPSPSSPFARSSDLTITLLQTTLDPPPSSPSTAETTIAIPVTVIQPTTVVGPGSVSILYDTSVLVSYVTLSPSPSSSPTNPAPAQPTSNTELRVSQSSTHSSSTFAWTPTLFTIISPTTVNGIRTTIVVTSIASAPALTSDGNSNNLQTTKKGLSGGAIGGIVAGAVLGAAILFAAGFWLSRKYQRSRSSEVEEAGEKSGSPKRNISTLSKTGLLAGHRRKTTPRNSNGTPPIVELTDGDRNANGVSPTSQRRTSALMYYDQRLNPTALATHHENHSHPSINTLKDEQDYSRPVLGVTNPDPPRPSITED